MKYTVYDSTYSRKDDVHAEASRILNKYRLNYEIKPPNRDFYWLEELIKNHKEAEEKIGAGVYAFRIQREPRYNHRGFIIIRKDGTTIDFSYKQCFPPKRTTAKQKILDVVYAFRTAVDNFTYEYKLSRLKSNTFKSDLSGAREDKLEVDHIYPLTFQQIVKDFIKKEQLDIFSIEVVGNTIRELKDVNLREKFHEYHAKVAKLRLLTMKENLTQPKIALTEKDFA